MIFTPEEKACISYELNCLDRFDFKGEGGKHIPVPKDQRLLNFCSYFNANPLLVEEMYKYGRNIDNLIDEFNLNPSNFEPLKEWRKDYEEHLSSVHYIKIDTYYREL